MHGAELKAIRKALGWNQQQLADALDMSRVYVGQMERDQKPIERRTELSLRWLGSQHDRATLEERVARTLCRLADQPDPAASDDEGRWQAFLPQARAVLAAIADSAPAV
jgi:transcriptional regulator with XRE-family HTH domain